MKSIMNKFIEQTSLYRGHRNKRTGKWMPTMPRKRKYRISKTVRKSKNTTFRKNEDKL